MKRGLIISLLFITSFNITADSSIRLFDRLITFDNWHFMLPYRTGSHTVISIDLNKDCEATSCFIAVTIMNFEQVKLFKESEVIIASGKVCGVDYEQSQNGELIATILYTKRHDYSVLIGASASQTQSFFKRLCDE